MNLSLNGSLVHLSLCEFKFHPITTSRQSRSRAGTSPPPPRQLGRICNSRDFLGRSSWISLLSFRQGRAAEKLEIPNFWPLERRKKLHVPLVFNALSNKIRKIYHNEKIGFFFPSDFSLGISSGEDFLRLHNNQCLSVIWLLKYFLYKLRSCIVYMAEIRILTHRRLC